MTPRKSGGGNCSSYSRGSCCTDLQEVDWSQRRSCKNESTSFCKDSGSRYWKHPSSCLFKEQQQVADGNGGRRTRSNGGPHVLSNFANLGSCLLHDKRWREQQSPSGNSRAEKLLKDETRRPRVVRTPIDRSILEAEPEEDLNLDVDALLQNLRTARRGAAAGPSGMTAEHRKPLLADTVCTRLFGEVAGQFARGLMPEEVLQPVKLGRMSALPKPDGGVRGIVVGDVFRRVVARTIAQQFTPLAGAATHPFQHALSSRAGTECVAHIVQTLSELDPRSTILSIDGVGAASSIPVHRGICGRTRWARTWTYSRERVANKGTPSCFCFLVWGTTGPLLRSTPSCRRENGPWQSWTTSS